MKAANKEMNSSRTSVFVEVITLGWDVAMSGFREVDFEVEGNTFNDLIKGTDIG